MYQQWISNKYLKNNNDLATDLQWNIKNYSNSFTMAQQWINNKILKVNNGFVTDV